MANRIVLSLLVAACVGGAARADDSRKKPAPQGAPETPLSVTSGEVALGVGKVEYDATAGFLPMRTEEGKERAHVFHVAYVKRGGDPARRPVTFVFNGGPGSSSIWLHLGGLGPRRVEMTDEGEALPPPGGCVNNTESWLGFTDLVFIDPVGTGFSRPAAGAKQSEFSGLSEDTESVGEFIRLWTTRNGRWRSPKYLCGESYGTTRAANLAGHLQGRYGMYLNGVVLVSTVLNFGTIRSDRGNDLPHVLFLPAFTATAWYHKRLPEDLQADLPKALAQAERFALEDYLVALAKGDALPAAERARIAKALARFTGLDEAFVDAAELRVSMGRFAKELLRDRRRTVGRLDSRFLGIDRDSAGEGYDYDPSMAVIEGPFSAAMKDYVRRDLKFESDLVYETLSGRVGRWRYPEGRYADVSESLRRAMTENPHLKVLVCAGLFDLATPYFAADYTVNHLGLAPELRGHLRVRTYEAGHMMYIHAPSRRQLTADAAEFYGWDPDAPAEPAR